MMPVRATFGLGVVNQTFEIRNGVLISPQKPIQLGFQGSPAAANLDGFYTAFGNVFKVGGAGNLEVFTGLFGAINDALAVFIKSVQVNPVSPVKTVASVGFFAPILAASALHDVIIYHKYHLISLAFRKSCWLLAAS
jgi:hypothetical protein